MLGKALLGTDPTRQPFVINADFGLGTALKGPLVGTPDPHPDPHPNPDPNQALALVLVLLVSVLTYAQLGLVLSNVLTIEDMRWRRQHPSQAP